MILNEAGYKECLKLIAVASREQLDGFEDYINLRREKMKVLDLQS